MFKVLGKGAVKVILTPLPLLFPILIIIHKNIRFIIMTRKISKGKLNKDFKKLFEK